MPYISCREVTLGYDGNVVTKNLNFTVNPGDYLCIVGENGTGKSTLIKAILNFKKPLQGKITRGDGLKSLEIGYVPQQAVIQKDFPASVQEVILSGCLNRCGLRPFYSRDEKAITAANMAKLGITELKKRCFRELSGGQKQRVLLARALCATRKLLLLDEPVAGLDPKVTAEMYTLIQKLVDEGITIIMVSHDINSAIQYASNILHLGEEPLFFGKTEDYKKSEVYYDFVSRTGGEIHE